MGDLQPREFQEALLDADSFEDLPGSGRWRSWKRSRIDPTCGFATSDEVGKD
jgi:hypothetical protein